MQATAPTVKLAPRRPAPRPRPPAPRHHADPLYEMDVAVESAVGVDLRLIYGMLVPVLLVIGLVLTVVFVQSYWLVAATWVVEIAFIGLIVAKTLAMLDEPDRPEGPSQPAE